MNAINPNIFTSRHAPDVRIVLVRKKKDFQGQNGHPADSRNTDYFRKSGKLWKRAAGHINPKITLKSAVLIFFNILRL